MMLLSLMVSATSEPINLATSSNEKSENLSTKWGQDALSFSTLIESHTAESLGLIISDPIVYSSTISQINQQQHKFDVNKTDSSYRVSSTLTESTNMNMSTLKAGFSTENFSAQTGLVSHSNDILNSNLFYLQGAYNIYDSEHLNLSVTAKIEAINGVSVNHYFGKQQSLWTEQSLLDKAAKNATIGIITTYSINKNWKILGMISSTSLDKSIESSPLIENSNIHTAHIGTSYSF